MVLIRKAEERIARDFKAGLLPGSVHLYIGQESRSGWRVRSPQGCGLAH